jgi:hypothetical protein
MTRGVSVALVAVAACAALAPIPQRAVERWYSSAVYPLLQHVLTPLSNLVPFALFDVLIVGAVAAAAVAVYRRVRASGLARGVARAAGALVVAAAVVYLAFLATWGLNYRRVPLVEKVAFDPARVTRDANNALGEWALAALNGEYGAR